jgi:hypothetical protein
VDTQYWMVNTTMSTKPSPLSRESASMPVTRGRAAARARGSCGLRADWETRIAGNDPGLRALTANLLGGGSLAPRLVHPSVRRRS